MAVLEEADLDVPMYNDQIGDVLKNGCLNRAPKWHSSMKRLTNVDEAKGVCLDCKNGGLWSLPTLSPVECMRKFMYMCISLLS